MNQRNPAKSPVDRIPGVSLRPESERDLEFLFRLYSSTRADEMALVPWDDEQIEDFLRMQFSAQRSYYLEHYREARFDVVEENGKPIGRLYVARWPDDIRVIDIALLPERRGGGLGGRIMQALLDEAADADQSVSIHVEVYNRAIRLYERLGFVPAGDEGGAYRLMEWRAKI